MLHTLLDFILHMDTHLNDWVATLGPSSVYALMALILFCETGLVVTPFLPGDSLLFALGALTAVENPQLSLVVLIAVLVPAVLLGDITNYSIGRFLGKRVLAPPFNRFVKQQYLERTEAFYAKHGGKTIILARFIPIVRTFAPFVAGVGTMRYPRFLSFSVVGVLLWVPVFLGLGHWFGNLPQVKQNFHLVIFGIIFVSVLPVLIEAIKHRRTNAF